jgi:hypothetical protein
MEDKSRESEFATGGFHSEFSCGFVVSQELHSMMSEICLPLMELRARFTHSRQTPAVRRTPLFLRLAFQELTPSLSIAVVISGQGMERRAKDACGE